MGVKLEGRQTKYSFSKLESFHNCKRAYYYTYGMGDRGGENIYSFLGTICHELTQAIIQGKETNESATMKFLQSIGDTEMLGLTWISEKVKENYVECISDFFHNYNPIKADNIVIEDYFEVEINGKIIRGYIDLWYILDNVLYIIDLKTSSKYSKKDLPKKSRQLYLYAYALKQKYPDIKIVLQFHMLKYVFQNNKLIERNKYNIFDNYEDGIIQIEYSQEAEKDLIEYVSNTTDEIEIMGTEDIELWEMAYNPHVDFFCRNLCSFQDKCII